MSDIAIRVENLSKLYRIGARLERHATLRDQIAEALAAPFRHLRGNGSQMAITHNLADTIWALKDVSFEVKEGEVLGIIGRNGAGKSTLLKILSRITEPTEGYAETYGHVGTLLEVGTGFHPELTGRENIYLSGAILGMKRSEIIRKFDEIVSFAEVEKFVDTPVKRYSSGMYVRLAFAVAAHLEPEILLVDEVLAVGDGAFQKKCLGKMGDVAREGRTVLFVSHNFEAIKSLCSRALVIENGSVAEDNTPVACIEKALLLQRESTSPTMFKLVTIRSHERVPQPIAIEIRASGKQVGEIITFDDDIVASLQLDSPMQEYHMVTFSVHIGMGTAIFNSFYRDDANNPPLQPGKTRSLSVAIPRHFLAGGVYEAKFGYMVLNADLAWHTRDTWFEVHEIQSYRNEGLTGKRIGFVSMILPWNNC
jgi:ABC-type polysaccharide/polyol phosphate transport system ATPase subunit